MITLHNYQREHIEQVLTDLENLRSIMLQMPTGTGKTHVFCEIAKKFHKNKKGRILVLAHRKELIIQIKERLEEFGLKGSIGIIQSGHIKDETKQIQIASIQTLCSKDKILFLKHISLIIVDEAHHTPSNTYLSILEAYQKEHTKLLGVTATPLRLDGKGFEKVFDKLICSYPFKWFINNRHLCAIKHYASDIIRLDNISIVKSKEGCEDYNEKETVEYYLDKNVMADIIESYKKFGENKKSIVFALTIKHAEEIAQRFNEAGFNATALSSENNSLDRKIKVEKFKKGEIQVLVNVDIFSEGFDCPNVEVVQIAKPTKSLVRYLQMAGRVTRIFEGKNYGIILDNSCLWQDHGLVTNDRKWFLDGNVIEDRNYEGLFFGDGTSGNEAYKKKVKEYSSIGVVLVDAYGLIGEIYFIRKTLRQLMVEYKLGKNDFFDYIESIDLNLKEHLQGERSLYNKKVSQQLNEIIDLKFSFNKGLNDITL